MRFGEGEVISRCGKIIIMHMNTRLELARWAGEKTTTRHWGRTFARKRWAQISYETDCNTLAWLLELAT